MSTTVRVKMLIAVMSLAAVLVMTPGCHRKKAPVTPNITSTQPTNENNNGSGQPEVDPSDILWGASGLQKVYFDYNSYSLRADALAALKNNAEMAQKFPNAYILCEGHCDARGTQEYNLALGEKRALAVRDHMIKLGVAADHLLTVSYGKERPAVEGNDESAWKMNRRVEFSKGVKK